MSTRLGVARNLLGAQQTALPSYFNWSINRKWDVFAYGGRGLSQHPRIAIPAFEMTLGRGKETSALLIYNFVNSCRTFELCRNGPCVLHSVCGRCLRAPLHVNMWNHSSTVRALSRLMKTTKSCLSCPNLQLASVFTSLKTVAPYGTPE